MSAPVDVLAEMERASVRLFDAGLHVGLGIEEAIAAVAELIEAVDRLTDSASSMHDGWDEAVAALARVKGGA